MYTLCQFTMAGILGVNLGIDIFLKNALKPVELQIIDILADKDRRINILKKSKSKFREENDNLQDEFENIKSINEMLKENISIQNEKLQDLQVKDVNSKVKEEEQSIKLYDLRKEYEELKDKYDNCTRNVEDESIKLYTLRKEYEELLVENDKLHQILKGKNNRIDYLENKIKKLESLKQTQNVGLYS